jgi:hypothetical protein
MGREHSSDQQCDNCRDRELELWKAKLNAKQDTAGKGAAGQPKQATAHAIMAWCHQPALRVRFSASHLEALAGNEAP